MRVHAVQALVTILAFVIFAPFAVMWDAVWSNMALEKHKAHKRTTQMRSLLFFFSGMKFQWLQREIQWTNSERTDLSLHIIQYEWISKKSTDAVFLRKVSHSVSTNQTYRAKESETAHCLSLVNERLIEVKNYWDVSMFVLIAQQTRSNKIQCASDEISNIYRHF